MITFLEQYQAALRAGVPLLCIRTFDAKSTIDGIKGMPTPSQRPFNLISWDTMRGAYHLNPEGQQALSLALTKAGLGQEATRILPETLTMAHYLPEDSILFISNAHLFWSDPSVLQGIWNLRDPFKANLKTLILLTGAGSILPMEIASD